MIYSKTSLPQYPSDMGVSKDLFKLKFQGNQLSAWSSLWNLKKKVKKLLWWFDDDNCATMLKGDSDPRGEGLIMAILDF